MSVPWYLMAKGKGGGGYKTASGPIVSVSDAIAAPLRSLVANIDPVQAGSGDPSPDNVRPISGWSAVNVWVEPTYDPTANPTATIQLGQTVYGGTLDVTTGVLKVTLKGKHTSDLTWVNNVNFANTFNGEGFTDRKIKIIGSIANDCYCNTYKWYRSVSVGSQTNGIALSESTGPYETLIYIKDSRFANKDEFIASFSTHDPLIVCPLATPITIQLTPTEVTTLLGQNNVWADSGDVTVEYLASGGANADLMKLAVAFMGRK